MLRDVILQDVVVLMNRRQEIVQTVLYEQSQHEELQRKTPGETSLCLTIPINTLTS